MVFMPVAWVQLKLSYQGMKCELKNVNDQFTTLKGQALGVGMSSYI